MNIHRPSNLLPVLAALLCGGSIHADGPPTLTSNELATVRAEEDQRATEARKYILKQRNNVGLNPWAHFLRKSVFTDAQGWTHTRFGQVLHGIPVWGAEATVHTNREGRIAGVTPALRPNVSLATQPSLGSAEALAVAHGELSSEDGFSSVPEVTLVIYPDIERTVKKEAMGKANPNAMDMEEKVRRFLLAYHLHIEQEDGNRGAVHTDFLIDAHSGRVIQKWPSLRTTGAIGSGNSQYSGTVPLNSNFNPQIGKYELLDTSRGTGGPFGGNGTTDLANHSYGPDYEVFGPLYTDTDNTWGDGLNYAGGPTTGTNGQTAAVDAHFGLAKSWDYFAIVHGRNGADGLGTAVNTRVHYRYQFNDAFWIDGCFCLTFGDGDGTVFRSLTALDVVGHELAHGVTQFSADLTYSGESGGLNEATSDIFGTMVEFYARDSSEGNWTIGEQIKINAPALRWMYKPSLDGISPDAWYNGIGNLNVHHSSGPMNRCFYFLSQGASSSPGSDFYSAYLPGGMAGIGSDPAARIWYRALTSYLSAGSQYTDARNAAVQAAVDLYGAASAPANAVAYAFAAINVGSAPDHVAPVLSSLAVQGSSGVITFSAAATDNVGVTEVRYGIDNNYYSSAFYPPWSVTVDSTQLSNGVHSVAATAYDAGGNASTPLTTSFNVQNSGFTEAETNDSLASANLVPDSATSLSGGVASMSDTDHFRINVLAGHTLIVSMDGDNAMELLDANGAVLASASSGYGTLSYTSPMWTTAAFYLRAKGYWEYTGNPKFPTRLPVYGAYTLALSR